MFGLADGLRCDKVLRSIGEMVSQNLSCKANEKQTEQTFFVAKLSRVFLREDRSTFELNFSLDRDRSFHRVVLDRLALEVR